MTGPHGSWQGSILCGRAGSPERAAALAEEHDGVHYDTDTDDVIVVEPEGLARLMGGGGAWSTDDGTVVTPGDGGDEILLRPIAPKQVAP